MELGASGYMGLRASGVSVLVSKGAGLKGLGVQKSLNMIGALGL